MAQKKKAQTAARSAKSASAAGKKAAAKAAAVAKKPDRSISKSKTKSKSAATKPATKPTTTKTVAPKTAAPKTAAKARVAAKGKTPAAKTAGTAAPVKSSAKTSPKTAVKARATASVKAPLKAPAKAPAKAAAPGKVPFVKTGLKPRLAVGSGVRAVAAAAKSPGQKISAPVAAPTSKNVDEKAAAARQLANAQKKPVSQRHGFKANEFIVYPAHGVGRIVGIEEQEIAGMALELFVINFEKEKLTLRVPTGKLESVGMRKLAEDGVVKKAMETLKGRARVKRTMWSRRAQEYVAKINSGDLIAIAEVVRDLYRSEAQPEQSYSERQLYEDALDRMARELAAVEKLDERGAVQRITEVLSKSARGRRLAAEEAETEADSAAAGGGDKETQAA
jgi:CarD family transcriptional regulator, regulator of rRNA transcription